MIIAVDFDGVLCENKFPAIGSPKTTHINLVKLLLSQGHEVILWTSRVEGELESAVNWCRAQGLEFTAVNNDAPSNVAEYFGKYNCPPRKIYADVYIDDHGAGYDDFKLEFMVMDMIARKEQEYGKR